MATLTKEQALANARARLQKNAPAPQVNAGTEQSMLERTLGRTGRSLAAGVGGAADLPRLLTDPLAKLAGAGAGYFSPEAGQSISSLADAPYLADAARNAYDEMTGNAYQPVSAGERIADKAAEYVTSAGGLGIAAKAASSAPALASFLSEGGVSGLLAAGGAGAGEEIARQNDVNPLVGALIGGVGTGLGASVTGGALKSNLAKNETGSVSLKGNVQNNNNPNKLSKAERTVARVLINEQGLTPQQAAMQVRKAGGGKVPLTLPERVDNKTLVKMQQRLTEAPSAAGNVMQDFSLERQKVALPQAYNQFVKDVTGKITTPEAAGGKISNAAGGVIDKAIARRADKAAPYYRIAEQQSLTDDQMVELLQSSPLTADYLKKITNDPKYQAEIEALPRNSIAILDVVKQAIDGDMGAAVKSGNNNDVRLLKIEKDKLTNFADKISPAYRQARQVFAENSPRIDKLNENVIGALNAVKESQPEKALAILNKESPAALRYARRTIGAMDNDAWQSIISAKLKDAAEKTNYSPTKILNQLSSKTGSGNIIKDQQLQAMLTSPQRRANDLFFTYLDKAQRVKFGSNTATNLQADDMLNSALGGKADAAQNVINSAVRGDKLGLIQQAAQKVFDWYDEGIRSGNYEELARIFVGQGSDDFADRLSKVKPSDLQGLGSIINERIASGAKQSAQGGRVGATQYRPEEGTQAGKPAPVLPTADILQKRQQALEAAKQRLLNKPPSPNNPQNAPIPREPLTLEITPQSNNTQMDFTQGNEGSRLTAYIDTTGNRTIGNGFNFNSGIAKKVWQEAGVKTPFKDAYLGKAAITPEEEYALYQTSKKIATDDAVDVFTGFNTYTPNAQAALIDLSYQYGKPSLKKNLKPFINHMNSGNINLALKALDNSDYAKKYSNRHAKVRQMLVGK